jgi:heme exporter protein C
LRLLLLGPLAAVLVMIFLYAPTEETMGEVQRILYLHVPAAWCGLLGAVALGVFGVAYLCRRNLAWDQWSQAAGEVSWLCVTVTLITGSIWAHDAWGVWWTWEPRLTSLLVLWLIYVGMFLVRAGTNDPHARARRGAALSLLAAADIPLVTMATRWFRGVHPVSPEMDSRMLLVLLVAVLSFTVFFTACVVQRRRQLGLTERLAAVEGRGF